MTWRDAGIEGPVQGHIDEALSKQDLIFRDTFVQRFEARVERARDGSAVAVVDVGPNVLHPGGFVHGGAIASLGDTAAAWATFSLMNDDETYTTIEFKCNFLRGTTQGRLRAEATTVHRGRKTVVVDVRVTDDASRLVAMMSVTQQMLPLSEGRPDQASR
jgi:1,4-dihydroxy-2-naphthoyl-CoA hydrolase